MCHTAGIQPGETTADGQLTLEFAECLGACEFAPCMLADKTLVQKPDERIGRGLFGRRQTGIRIERPQIIP